MKIADFVDAGSVVPCLKATTKKQVLQDIAQQLAGLVAIDQRIIFETLLRAKSWAPLAWARALPCHTDACPAFSM